MDCGWRYVEREALSMMTIVVNDCALASVAVATV